MVLNRHDRFILVLLSISLLFFSLLKILPVDDGERLKTVKINASEIMQEAISTLSGCLAEKNLVINRKYDINSTGLIGVEDSPMTTTLGNLEAKRTTTNPNMAALVVQMLHEAGVRKGDAVAVGASGSFPALLVAVMSGAKAMDVNPIIICSLGSSQWGANRPDFHFLHMLDCLSAAGILSVGPTAVSLGGEKDVGESMASQVRERLIQDIQESKILFIQEDDLQTNVRTKMQIYERFAGKNGIKGFINIGGSWSNVGTSPEILKLGPGLAKINRLPPIESRGLVYEMASRDIPVIHLLFIRGLVELYGLPWDPVPLPSVGKGRIFQGSPQDSPHFPLFAAAYLCVMILLLFWYKTRKRSVITE